MTFQPDWLLFHPLNRPKAFLPQDLCTHHSLCHDFFTPWFLQLVSSQASDLKCHFCEQSPLLQVIHYPLSKVNESITFFTTFQVIIENYNYLACF